MRVASVSMARTRRWCHDTGVVIGYAVLIAGSAALQFYKQRLVRETSPVAFAALAKCGMGLLYLAYMAYRAIACANLGELFAHAHRMNRCGLVSFLAVLCLLGAATLALDMMAFVYLDLATKQVIDAAIPVAVLVVGVVLYRALERCRPRTYVTGGATLTLTHRRIGRGLLRAVQVACVLGMVAGSVWVVWSTPDVSLFGVAVNGTTLFTSAVGLILTETLLKWQTYSAFGLMVVTVLPEIVVLGAISWALDEPRPAQAVLPHVGVVAATETLLKALSFYLLRETRSVDLSVAGVVVFALVVAGDMVLSGSAGVQRVVGVCVTGVALATYTGLGYAGRTRELVRKPSGEEVVESESAGSSGDLDFDVLLDERGLVRGPFGGFCADEDPFSIGEPLSQPLQRSASVCDRGRYTDEFDRGLSDTSV